MNKETTYNRSKHDTKHPYVKIASRLIMDNRLNATAIGLFCIILNNADSYILNKKDIQKKSNLNSNQFRNAWELLMQCNYIEAVNKGNHKWHYIINEDGESKMLQVAYITTTNINYPDGPSVRQQEM